MSGSSTNWTNSSVRSFAGDSDPVEAIVRHSRELTLRAMDEGWEGPPFDPAALARWLHLDVVPKEDIRDARILAGERGSLRIEFNPNRSGGRVRYSIAHEIAHSFFPDCAESIRNRSSKSEQSGDEWQLEMLCNIAAAEILMPAGTLPDLRTRSLDIDELMQIRRTYDVSTEALLLRYVRLTKEPLALFAASRQESGPYTNRYRIDYAVGSTSWTENLESGRVLPDGTIASECTAIGFTAKGTERWNGLGTLNLECVGVPPYPRNTFPRVLGLLRGDSPGRDLHYDIRYLKGDALNPRDTDPRIIAHIVNNASATWGAGFARQAAKVFGEAQVDFRRWVTTSGNHELGNVHMYGEPNRLRLASMVAQRGFGKSPVPRISYPSLERCLITVRDAARDTGASVHMPRIGCGQAGGQWDVVSEIIRETLVQSGVPVTIYDLP